MNPTLDCLTDQGRRAQRRGRITMIGILALIGVLGVVLGVIVIFLLPSIPRIKKTPYRGRIIEFEWSQDLVSNEPAVRETAVAVLCEAMQDKDRAVR